jgi:hypothetical protein
MRDSFIFQEDAKSQISINNYSDTPIDDQDEDQKALIRDFEREESKN